MRTAPSALINERWRAMTTLPAATVAPTSVCDVGAATHFSGIPLAGGSLYWVGRRSGPPRSASAHAATSHSNCSPLRTTRRSHFRFRNPDGTVPRGRIVAIIARVAIAFVAQQEPASTFSGALSNGQLSAGASRRTFGAVRSASLGPPRRDRRVRLLAQQVSAGTHPRRRRCSV